MTRLTETIKAKKPNVYNLGPKITFRSVDSRFPDSQSRPGILTAACLS